MAVKQMQSAARVLATFEAVVSEQPIGLGALARRLGEDKSALQRALATLASAGWIEPANSGATGWQASNRVLVLAHVARRGSDVVQRARQVLEQLRDETEETIILNVPDGRTLVIVDAVVSHQVLRTSPKVGMLVPVSSSAAGRALLSHLPMDEVIEFVDGEPPPDLGATLAADRERGWSINAEDVAQGVTAVGAAVLTADGRPVASITISVPIARMPFERYDELGAQVARAAAELSDGQR